MKFLILIYFIFSLGCARDRCNSFGPFRAAEVDFPGHRMSHPSSGNIPAQTMESLRELIATGSGAVEFDVSSTSDNKLIAFHDRDTCQMTGKSRVVENTLFRDLPLIVGGYKIPKLQDAIEEIISAPALTYVIVDIKNVSPAAFDDFFGLVQSLRQRKTVVIQMSETRRNISRLPMYCRRFREIGLDVGRNYSRGSLCGRWGSK